ncbi:MAG: NF038122 family metalloprotease [Phycisphaerales bacterium]|nr:MAG: NF038122 family metalloprotease [Phycisphaerales bacterium]
MSAITTVPESILFDRATGKSELVLREIVPTTLEVLRERLPDAIPVYSKEADGAVHQGIRFCNTASAPNRSPRLWCPAMVVISPDGVWSIDDMVWGMVDGVVMPGDCVEIAGGEDARLMVARDRSLDMLEPLKRQITPRAPSFTVDYNSQFAPAEFVGHDAEVIAAIERALDVYRSILMSEDFQVTVQIRWATLDENVLMQTSNLVRDFRPWSGLTGVRIQFVADSFFDDETFETNIIDTLPMGPTVPYRWGANGSTQTSSICLSVPLLKKWYGSASNDPIHIEINNTLRPINEHMPQGPRRRWRLDERIGPGISNEEYDFVGAIVHELGHGLGFWSELEPAQDSFYNFISNWDIFRMPATLAPIGASTFETTPRELRPSEDAVGVTGFGTTQYQYFVSRGAVTEGDGNGAAHWRDAGSAPIGIMRPGLASGESLLVNGAYLQESDIRAFDIMGFNILQSNVQPPAAPVIPVTPGQGAMLRPGDVLFEWQPAFGAVSYGVVLLDLGQSGTSDPVVVHSQLSITETTYVVTQSTFTPGHVYLWRQFSNNTRGFATVERQYSVACWADVDDGSGTGVPDGGVLIDDLLYYNTIYMAGLSEADLDDGSGQGVPDGGVTVDDFLFYLSRFTSGC